MNMVYQQIDGGARFYFALAVLTMIMALGAAAAHYMELEGHHVTGMTNQVVWGVPHVFAVFLIIAASGALNTASIASVFGKAGYKPLARLSGLLAVALLVGGLTVLVLDLGRPDRLIVAMTTYNFKSIFAWNIFLYTGFLLIVAVYLWMMFEPRMNRYIKPGGLVAFLWRLILTTGTGSIFGFLVARQAYDAAIMAPMFVIMSLAFGTAMFMLIWFAACAWTGVVVDAELARRLKNLLGMFIAAVLYMSLAYHLTNLYATEHHGYERFLLLEGGAYTALFWFGHVLIGGVFPLLLLFSPAGRSTSTIALAATLVVAGGLAQVYVIIIAGQAYPMPLFPGMTETSTFFDGVVAGYSPSLYEIGLGMGGVALSLLIVVVALRVLPFFPHSTGSRSTADSESAAASAG
jgi:molybdopterin-containing oxidoreductase family membrane subunit